MCYCFRKFSKTFSIFYANFNVFLVVGGGNMPNINSINFNVYAVIHSLWYL